VGLVCRPLEPYAAHLFTTRQWSAGSSATPEVRPAAWPEVARAMGVECSRLIRLSQVHGAAYVVAGSPPEAGAELPHADIVTTDRQDLALVVQVADCVPLLIADAVQRADRAGRPARAVAAAHAGWRGLAARVPDRAVAALGREWGSQARDLIAVIGPSIGSCCYEVGLDVRRRFAEAGFGAADLDRWFRSVPAMSARNPSMAGLPLAARDNHWYFDGWQAARHQLLGAGIPEGSIYCAELCTASHPDWLCSYRRDGSPAGRLAGAIRSLCRP
jgi:YfiH family protein